MTSGMSGPDSLRTQTIHDDVSQHGLDAKGPPVVGFFPGDDPRIRATVLAIADQLTDVGVIRRCRQETTYDALDEPEGTFAARAYRLVS